MKHVVAAVALLAACNMGDPDDPPPIDNPAACEPEIRATKRVTVSGTVIDFATAAPVGGATVDIGTAWDGSERACPVIDSVTTRADGTFGPIEVAAGSTGDPVFMMFRVHGADRALTASDNRTCPEASCTLTHVIPTPSRALADSWRGALADGGMADADTRGLVAFEYKNLDGVGAAGVVPSVFFLGSGQRAVTPGLEVRFLDADRASMMPVAASSTSASGVALVGIENPSIYIGGNSATAVWNATGCLVVDGAIFLENRTQDR